MILKKVIMVAVTLGSFAPPKALAQYWYGVDGPVPLMVSAGEGTQAIAVNLEDNREDYVT